MLRVAIYDYNIVDITIIKAMAARLFKGLDINFEMFTYLKRGMNLQDISNKLKYELVELEGVFSYLHPKNTVL